jgi:hypothetical protein
MLAILTLSFYSLVLAEQMLLKAGMRIGPALVIIYALSGIAGAVWAPQSLPRSADDDANAARREGKWLPWVVAVQGGLVSLGVFLGVWAAQGSEAWAYFLVAGLGALTALIMVTLGFVSLYRFVILASAKNTLRGADFDLCLKYPPALLT